MSALDAGAAGRKSDQPLTPILVSVRQAKALLGGMAHDKFWRLAMGGAFGPLVGPSNKRYLFYKNLEAYAAGLKREPSREYIRGRKSSTA